MDELGGQFEQGTLFLLYFIAASEAMSAGVAVLTPVLKVSGSETKSRGSIVIGTIEGDLHSIGKDISHRSRSQDSRSSILVGTLQSASTSKL